jgi:Flp pilus assembly pilin Flp
MTLFRFFKSLHRDERGAVSLETILIIGAIAIPILIFLVRVGWPMVKDQFTNNTKRLQIESDRVANGG